MLKRYTLNLLLILFSSVIALVFCEFVFRAFIFSDISLLKNLKDPGKYASIYTDDYWKLYYAFDGGHPPPKDPHPLLGWKTIFDPVTYVHRDLPASEGKSKVLLFGDSFAQCIDTVLCFEDLMNADTTFNKNHYLLNYGVGGYGVDQIYLLCSLTVNQFRDAFIVVSILPTDMDRSVLTVRTGQKPWFELSSGKLELKGVPIESVPSEFFEKNPPEIKSYMYARLMHSDLNPNFNPSEMPEDLKNKSLALNNQILHELNNLLKNSGNKYIFMIFDNLYNDDGDWRYFYLMNFMHENNYPYFGTKDLVECDTTFSEFVFDRYIVSGDGHPTSYYNSMVADEIEKFVYNYDEMIKSKKEFYSGINKENDIAHFVYQIKKDKGWLNSVKEKAIKNGIPLDSMIQLDARWMIEEQSNKK